MRRCEPLVVKNCKKRGKGIGITLDCYHPERSYELHITTSSTGTVVTPAPQLHPTGRMMTRCNWKNLVSVKIFSTGKDLPPDGVDAFQEQWCYNEAEMGELDFKEFPTPESSSYYDSDEDGSEYDSSEYDSELDESAIDENPKQGDRKSVAPIGPSI